MQTSANMQRLQQPKQAHIRQLDITLCARRTQYTHNLIERSFIRVRALVYVHITNQLHARERACRHAGRHAGTGHRRCRAARSRILINGVKAYIIVSAKPHARRPVFVPCVRVCIMQAKSAPIFVPALCSVCRLVLNDVAAEAWHRRPLLPSAQRVCCSTGACARARSPDKRQYL